MVARRRPRTPTPRIVMEREWTFVSGIQVGALEFDCEVVCAGGGRGKFERDRRREEENARICWRDLRLGNLEFGLDVPLAVEVDSEGRREKRLKRS
jgi:hypothetical protein